MNQRQSTASASTSAPAASASAAKADVLPYKATETTLSNGLKVIIVPTGMPNLVSLQIPVQTGSRNEVEPGKTGFAHFFEHIVKPGEGQIGMLGLHALARCVELFAGGAELGFERVAGGWEREGIEGAGLGIARVVAIAEPPASNRRPRCVDATRKDRENPCVI